MVLFNQFPPLHQTLSLNERLDQRFKALALLPVTVLEFLQFLLNLWVVFTGHSFEFTFFKPVILFVPNVLVLGRIFAWCLAAANIWENIAHKEDCYGYYKQDHFQCLVYTLELWFPSPRPKTSQNQKKSEKDPVKGVTFLSQWACSVTLWSCLNFPRSVNIKAASGVGHSTNASFSQPKDNQSLSYYQEQLLPESLGISVGKLLL